MKKIKFIFSSLLCFLLVLTGCSCSKNPDVEKFVGKGVKGIESYVDISDIETLNTMIEDKESFVLYVYNSSCSFCNDFKKYTLIPFILETEMEIFAIEERTPGLSTVVKCNVPCTIIFNKGSIVAKEEGKLKNVAELRKFISKYVILPQIYHINKTQLDELKSSDSEFLLYFESSTCPDCRKFRSQSLIPFLKSNTLNIDFYVYVVDDDRENADIWQTFKDDYGLSNKYNQKGYGVGYVPTVQYINDGGIVDMMVFFNDLDRVTYEDGTFSYSTSYYVDSPALTLHFNDYTDYQERTFNFYNQKFIDFVNNYNK